MSLLQTLSTHYIRRTSELPDTTGPITIVAWVRMQGDQNAVSCVFDFALSGTSWMQLITDSTGNDLELRDSTSGTATSGSVVNNVWTHLALTKSATTGYTAYQDGTQIGTHTGEDSSSDTLRIGNTASNQFLRGNYAMIKIWEAELTQAEIQAEMYTVRPQRYQNLYAWYPTPNTPGIAQRDFLEKRDLETSGIANHHDPNIAWGAPVWVLPFEVAPSDLTISVSDAVDAAESVTVSIPVTDLTLSVSDAVTAGEIVTAENAGPLSAAPSDAVTLGESVAVVNTGPLSATATDAITIAESVTVQNTGPLSTSATDAATVADTATVVNAGPLTATVTDAVTLGESVAVVNAGPLSAAPSDAITVGESVTVGITSDLAIAPSDAVAVGEVVAVVNTGPLSITATDAVTAGEAVSAAATGDNNVSVTDAITLGESVTVANAGPLSITATDAVTTGESVSVETQDPYLNIAVADGITILDIVTASILVTPLIRKYAIAAEDREYAIAAESRTYTIT